MSKSHQYNLPIIAHHWTQFGIGDAWIEPKAAIGYDREKKRPVIERPDVAGMIERAVREAWQTVDGQSVYLMPGQTMVGEYKEVLSDLRADEHKAARQPGVLALGDFRGYWIRGDGPIRPEMIPEGNGWGVFQFDDNRVEIARGPSLQTRVARYSWNVLAVQQMRRAHSRSGQVQAEAMKSIVRGDKMQGSPKRAASASAPYRDKHVEACYAFLQEAPGTLSQMCAMLRDDHNHNITAPKLDKKLRPDPRFIPGSAGNAWSVKEVEARASA